MSEVLRRFAVGASALVAVGWVAVLGADLRLATPTATDFVIRNGVIRTMAGGDPTSTVEAIAVRDGRVVAVGADALGVDATTPVVDLGGRTLLPGLVDAHSHWWEHGVNDGRSPEEIATWIASHGITTTAEFHVRPDQLDVLVDWAAAGRIGIRTSAYLVHTDVCGASLGDWWRAHPPTREFGEMLRIGGVKVFADGGACNRPAVSFAFADGSHGDLYYDVSELAAVVAEIDGAGHQVAIHALGDRAVATALEALDQVIDGGSNPRRHRIDHNAIVGPDLIGRYGEVGAVAVVFGAFPTCFVTGTEFPNRTPDEFADWEWPYRGLLDANPGLLVGWHADGPLFDASPGRMLEGFATRNEGDCAAPPGLADGAISVAEALPLMTIGSAHALDRETEVGSIEVGKLADFVVLDADPMAALPHELAAIEAQATFVGGDVVYCRDATTGLCAGFAPLVVEPTDQPSATEHPAVGTSATVGVTSEPPLVGLDLAAGAVVGASTALAEFPAAAAVDGDIESGWISGASAPQWIELDLGEPSTVRTIALRVDQHPGGVARHVITGGNDPAPDTVLTVIEQSLEWGDWIVVSGEWPDVRHLRVATTASPSWVSWLEILVGD